jgi:hypothetical protein
MEREFCEGDLGGSDDSSSFHTNRIREMNTFELGNLKLASKNEPIVVEDTMLKNVIQSNNKEGGGGEIAAA